MSEILKANEMVNEFLSKGIYWDEVVRRPDGGEILWQEFKTILAQRGLTILWILKEWAEQNKPDAVIAGGEMGSNGFKKCSWCGKEVAVKEDRNIGAGFGKIGCGTRNCPGENHYFHDGISKAKRAWNRRVRFE
jgi:hypothetical protein